MTGHRTPPLFDVDGPLLPFDDGSRGERSGAEATAHWVRLDPQMGSDWGAAVRPGWATTWRTRRTLISRPESGCRNSRSEMAGAVR